MSLTKWAGFGCGAASLALCSVGLADDTGANEDLHSKVRALEAEVARLKNQQGDDWLTEQRAEEIRGLVHDVLADADTRASLLQSGMNAGYDNGFFIGSTDGNWSLRLNGHLQTRFIYNNQNNGPDDPPGTADDNRWGFENTRTKLIFSGNIVDPSWTYKVEGDFGRRAQGDGAFGLQDAWIRWDYGSGWGVKMGQFRAPVTRETLVYSGHQLAVERSDVDYIYGGGFTQGIAVEYVGDQFKWVGSYNDGAGSDNTSWDVRDTEFSFTTRFEFMAMGNWDQFDDFTSWAGDENGLLIGAAAHWQEDEYGSSGTVADDNEDELFILTLDAQAEFGGFNLFGAFIYRKLDPNVGDSADQYGIVLQGGYHFAEGWEIFGRFEWADTDQTGPVADEVQVLTVGFNRYISGHNVKWTTDLLFAFDELPTDLTNSITGLRGDTPGEDDQIAIRTQLQLMF